MRALLLAPLALAATPAAAQAPVRFLVDSVEEAAGRVTVTLVALNPGTAAAPLAAPPRLDGTLSINGSEVPVLLDRQDAPAASIAPGGFARLRYALRAPDRLPRGAAGTLTIRALGMERVALALAPAATQLAETAPPSAAAEPSGVQPSAEVTPATPPAVARGNAFLGNLSAYRPIYAVYGPGTNSDARLQISFQYQLFGDPATPPDQRGLLDNLRFAYTQRMFWDLGAESSPFRNIDYMPEIFYLVPERRVGNVLVGGQAGFMHQSNGRDGDASRSLNMVYVQPMATVTTGRYRISAGPRGWLYVGSLEDNPDIRRYRGNLGLHADIDRDDGFRLSATSRFSVQTGRAAVDTEISYPLDAIVGKGPNLYLFGQAFAGYGETLLDYRKRQTRLRIGFGIVR